MKLEYLDKTKSYLMIILGLKVGFDAVFWHEGCLMLEIDEKAVASLEGDYLVEFIEKVSEFDDLHCENLMLEWDLHHYAKQIA